MDTISKLGGDGKRIPVRRSFRGQGKSGGERRPRKEVEGT